VARHHVFCANNSNTAPLRAVPYHVAYQVSKNAHQTTMARRALGVGAANASSTTSPYVVSYRTSAWHHIAYSGKKKMKHKAAHQNRHQQRHRVKTSRSGTSTSYAAKKRISTGMSGACAGIIIARAVSKKDQSTTARHRA